MHSKPMRVKFSVEGASKRGTASLHREGSPVLSISECLAVEGASALVCALQPHDREGSSRQFLINEEHESSSEGCLQQFGFKAFVESHYSKTPKRKEVRKNKRFSKKQYYFAKVYS